ncbi:hypothetical protein RYX36_021170 [Vicia faba]
MEVGPRTIHIPTREKLYVFNAAMVSYALLKTFPMANHSLFYILFYGADVFLYFFSNHQCECLYDKMIDNILLISSSTQLVNLTSGNGKDAWTSSVDLLCYVSNPLDLFSFVRDTNKASLQDTIVLDGAEYGSGSSRDWAAKAPINLVGMGIIPLFYKPEEDTNTLRLNGHERYTIDLPSKIIEIKPDQDVKVATDNGKSFTCIARFDTKLRIHNQNFS